MSKAEPGAPSFDEQIADLSATSAEGLRELPARIKLHREEVRAHLAALHSASSSGRPVNEANSDLTDRLVRRLVALAEEEWMAEGGQVGSVYCVAAVGGYARREMAIHSDVDLLLLYRGELSPHVQRVAERLQQWLWDGGLTVGCATRTIEQTLDLGHEEATVRTAVLMARFLVGDGEFFHEFADAVREGLLPDVAAFVAEQRELRQARHDDFGESLFLLQPNVKEGAGGLRDYHCAYWVLRAAQPSARDIDDLLNFGLLTEAEMEEFRNALEFLWRVRNDLHLRSKRAQDQMSFELQEQVAEALGYAESENELSVESFMRDYYRHARAIESYSRLAIEQCHARVKPHVGERVVREVEHGFRIAEEHLEIPHPAHLREDPLRLLRVFEVSQRYDVPLSRMARRLVREQISLIDEAYQASPEASEIFLRILAADERVTRTLIDMNDEGLLGAYIPEWEHIVCRWQHVIYHTYTVDVHSIFLVEELRRLWRGEYEELEKLMELIRSHDDQPVLYLGCLLHDIGKGFGGDHSNKGAALAEATVARLGLSPERAARVIFLVREHLNMSHIAQRRDLADPKLILEFAQRCGDRTNLRNLYLMTFADIRASSREAFTGWKAQLLHELYERCAECLETGADSAKAVELADRRVETRRDGAAKELLEAGIEEARVLSYFDGMPRRYFVAHTPRQIARHARVVLEMRPDQPFSTAVREMRGGFTELILWAKDVHGLFAQVAGTLTASGLDILGAHVYTTRAGLALEVFRVRTPPGESEARGLMWGDFEARLTRVLAGAVDVKQLLAARRRRAPGSLPRREAPTVSVSNEISDFYTVVDIAANDRLGLLYDLARTIGERDLAIYVSKAATIRDQVADTFYVKDRAGRKLQSTDELEQALCKAIGDGAVPRRQARGVTSD